MANPPAAAPGPTPSLTPRQQQILDLIARGLTNQDIAEALGISVNTVKVHVNGLIRALDVSNRTEAVFMHGRLREQAQAAAGDKGQPPTLSLAPCTVAEESAGARTAASAFDDALADALLAWRWFPVRRGASTTSADNAGGYRVAARAELADGGSTWRVELVHDASGHQLWAERLQADASAPETAAGRIALLVSARMIPELLRRAAQYPAANAPPAWTSAAQALAGIYVGDEQACLRARSAAQEAVRLDAGQVFSHYVAAAAAYQCVFNGWSTDAGADLRTFTAAAEAAAALDLSDAMGQEICGFARLVQGRKDDAIVHLERATRLNPAYAQAWSELGQARTCAGQFDAGIEALRRALELLPEGDTAWSAQGGLAMASLAKGDEAGAVDHARRFVAMNPKLATPRACLAAYLACSGAIAEAQTLRAEVLRDAPDFDARTVVLSFAMVSEELASRITAGLNDAGFAVS